MAVSGTTIMAGLVGVAIGEFAYATVKKYRQYHSSENPHTLAGISVVIREEALNWNLHSLLALTEKVRDAYKTMI